MINRDVEIIIAFFERKCPAGCGLPMALHFCNCTRMSGPVTCEQINRPILARDNDPDKNTWRKNFRGVKTKFGPTSPTA